MRGGRFVISKCWRCGHDVGEGRDAKREFLRQRIFALHRRLRERNNAKTQTWKEWLGSLNSWPALHGKYQYTVGGNNQAKSNVEMGIERKSTQRFFAYQRSPVGAQTFASPAPSSTFFRGDPELFLYLGFDLLRSAIIFAIEKRRSRLLASNFAQTRAIFPNISAF
jgi:hypothetical protein